MSEYGVTFNQFLLKCIENESWKSCLKSTWIYV